MNKKYIFYIFFLAFWIVFSISFSGMFSKQDTLLQMMLEECDGLSIDKCIVFGALFTLLYTKCDVWLQNRNRSTHFFSLILSSFMLIGMSYSTQGNWNFLFGNKKQLIIAVIVFIGYFILFDFMLCILYQYLIRHGKENRETTIPSIINNHYLLFCFLVIVCCWLPYFIVYLPGSVPYDGYNQLNQFFGITKISNNHPWISTMFFGFLMKIGRYINDNFGIFFTVSILYVIQAFCYGFACYKIKTWHAPRIFRMGALIFYSIVPLFKGYATTIIKDGIYTALFTLFMTLYIDDCICHEKDKSNNKSLIPLFFTGLSVCLLRNNGIYLILPAMIFLYFFSNKERKKHVVILVVFTFFSYYLLSTRIPATIGIESGSAREMLSIPFQQTARYLKEYPNDVTEQEKETISALLDYDALSKYYNPEVSDPVKATFSKQATKTELKNYFKTWWEMFLKHPDAYFEATFHNTFAYYYPFYRNDDRSLLQAYIMGEPLATGDFNIYYIMPQKIRNSVGSYMQLWRKLPIFSLFMSTGMYTWLLLILTGYLFYCRQYKGVLVLAAPFLNVLICIASPINGYLRYTLPVIASMPMIMYWCFIYTAGFNDKNKTISTNTVNNHAKQTTEENNESTNYNSCL